MVIESGLTSGRLETECFIFVVSGRQVVIVFTPAIMSN